MIDASESPVPGQEYPPADEPQTIVELLKFQLNLMKQSNPRVRVQHPKGHGCVRAEFSVPEGLPAELRFGVFREPAAYPALLRFSNGFSGDDRTPDFHGLALKLIGVPLLPRLDGDAPTQDFLLLDAPVFFAANVKQLLGFMQENSRLAAGGLSPEEQMQQLAKSFPREAELLMKHSRRADVSLLATDFWSCTPYRLGGGAVKYHVRPATSDCEGEPEIESEHALREAMVHRLTTQGRAVDFDFLVQRQTDAASMPIEDATAHWDSPFEKVATIHIPPQQFDTPLQQAYGENLSFNSWNSLETHRPLGGINRSRRLAYPASSELRHRLNQVAMHEPQSIDEFPQP